MALFLHTLVAFLGTASAVCADGGCGIGSSLLARRFSLTSKALQILRETDKDTNALKRSVDRPSLGETEAALQELTAGVVNGSEEVTDTMSALLSSIREDLLGIVNETKDEHTRDQNEIDRAGESVAECGNFLTEYPDKGAASSAAEQSHNTCRTNEAQLMDDKKIKCDEYIRASSSQPHPPQCMCNPTCYDPNPPEEDFDSSMACVKEIHAWSAALDADLTAKKEACDVATQEHEAAVHYCTTNQTLFEAAFCDYRQSLTGACSDYATCRTSKLALYEEVKGEVEDNENGRKAELNSVEHIRCLLDVFEVPSAQQQDKLQECQGVVEASSAELDTLKIIYPDLPQEEACDVSPVNPYPCAPEWVRDHYESSSWFAGAPPADCVATAGCTAAEETTEPPVEQSALHPPGIFLHIDASAGSEPGDLSGQNAVLHGGSAVGPPTKEINGRPAWDFKEKCVYSDGVQLNTEATVFIVSVPFDDVRNWGCQFWHGDEHQDFGIERHKLYFYFTLTSYGNPDDCSVGWTRGEPAVWSARTNELGREIWSTTFSNNAPVKKVKRSTLGSKNGRPAAGLKTMSIGGWSADCHNHFNGFIGEVIYYNKGLSDDEMTQVTDDLVRKWLAPT